MYDYGQLFLEGDETALPPNGRQMEIAKFWAQRGGLYLLVTYHGCHDIASHLVRKFLHFLRIPIIGGCHFEPRAGMHILSIADRLWAWYTLASNQWMRSYDTCTVQNYCSSFLCQRMLGRFNHSGHIIWLYNGLRAAYNVLRISYKNEIDWNDWKIAISCLCGCSESSPPSVPVYSPNFRPPFKLDKFS